MRSSYFFFWCFCTEIFGVSRKQQDRASKRKPAGARCSTSLTCMRARARRCDTRTTRQPSALLLPPNTLEPNVKGIEKLCFERGSTRPSGPINVYTYTQIHRELCALRLYVFFFCFAEYQEGVFFSKPDTYYLRGGRLGVETLLQVKKTLQLLVLGIFHHGDRKKKTKFLYVIDVTKKKWIFSKKNFCLSFM